MKKKEAEKLCYLSNSENRLGPFTMREVRKVRWTFQDLLSLFSSADVPSKQEGFEEFYSLLEKKAPLYQGPAIDLFRGTSMETIEKHGPGLIWTQDQKVAIDFANACCSVRYKLIFGAIDETPAVQMATVPKKHILYSHTNDRGEQETLLRRSFLERDLKKEFDYFVFNRENGGLV